MDTIGRTTLKFTAINVVDEMRVNEIVVSHDLIIQVIIQYLIAFIGHI